MAYRGYGFETTASAATATAATTTATATTTTAAAAATSATTAFIESAAVKRPIEEQRTSDFYWQENSERRNDVGRSQTVDASLYWKRQK